MNSCTVRYGKRLIYLLYANAECAKTLEPAYLKWSVAKAV